MGMASPSPRGGGVQPGINITPLVDVTLVVLIIFMVVAPMMFKTFTVSIPPPTSAAGAAPPADATPPVLLVLDEQGNLQLNRRAIQETDLPTALPPLLAAANPPVLKVAADDRLAYGRVIGVLDSARSAGAHTISVVTTQATGR